MKKIINWKISMVLSVIFLNIYIIWCTYINPDYNNNTNVFISIFIGLLLYIIFALLISIFAGILTLNFINHFFKNCRKILKQSISIAITATTIFLLLFSDIYDSSVYSWYKSSKLTDSDFIFDIKSLAIILNDTGNTNSVTNTGKIITYKVVSGGGRTSSYSKYYYCLNLNNGMSYPIKQSALLSINDFDILTVTYSQKTGLPKSIEVFDETICTDYVTIAEKPDKENPFYRQISIQKCNKELENMTWHIYEKDKLITQQKTDGHSSIWLPAPYRGSFSIVLYADIYGKSIPVSNTINITDSKK